MTKKSSDEDLVSVIDFSDIDDEEVYFEVDGSMQRSDIIERRVRKERRSGGDRRVRHDRRIGDRRKPDGEKE